MAERTRKGPGHFNTTQRTTGHQECQGEMIFLWKSSPAGLPIPNSQPQKHTDKYIVQTKQVIFRNIILCVCKYMCVCVCACVYVYTTSFFYLFWTTLLHHHPSLLLVPFLLSSCSSVCFHVTHIFLAAFAHILGFFIPTHRCLSIIIYGLCIYVYMHMLLYIFKPRLIRRKHINYSNSVLFYLICWYIHLLSFLKKST